MIKEVSESLRLIFSNRGGINAPVDFNAIDEARPNVTQDSYRNNLVSLQTFGGHPFHKQD